ncbi:protoheme IX farnesyltransferase [Iodidimonas muriae]|uniref:Protoheme IX farnesyltransferase n=1 Tax=Iodidimonas muriae TaxID=261467 RepID=A0ABQ2LD51_9PROT|nr:heme o synthase [Iodidimonas muriae]GER07288.1 protoheme IX farnesyltransferase [Kordiimonadales bacterium JCM 17843]GGO11104.1 protoheme IX farnesyltransferase [Iodidimonas muriae]
MTKPIDPQIATQSASGANVSLPYGQGDVRDYALLLKPRVMSLVVFTGFVGMLVAPGSLHPVLAFAAVLCIAVGAGAAGALNMWFDADIDAVMARTAKRPVPSGKLTANDALGFGLVLSVGSVTFMALALNLAAATLLALTIVFYAVIYTIWLKRRTPQNIVIGGAAGAFPPMIGYAAVTGSVTIESLVLFAIIFLWTPPHFWALALFVKMDYSRAGVPILPTTSGEPETRRQILLYSVLLAVSGLLPWVLGFGGVAYGVISSVLGAVFVYRAFRLWQGIGGADRRLFTFSILYLFLIFATLGAEHVMGAV